MSQPILVLFDTETTGLKFDTDDVVQLACIVHYGEGEEVDTFEALAQPRKPIPEAAAEVHGITDEAVADCPPSRDVVREWWSDIHTAADGRPILFGGHNTQFDCGMVLKYLPTDAVHELARNVCTLRLARKLYPYLENHKLQTVYWHCGRYDDRAAQAHNALADCWMSFHVLQHMKEDRDWTYHQLMYHHELQMSVITHMPFGKHKGKRLTDVPLDYVEWLLGRDIQPDLRQALEQLT